MRPAMVEKQKTIDHITNQISSAKATFVVQYQGLDVQAISSLRKELKTKGATITIFKNNLFARALQKSSFQELENALIGPNAFIFGFEDDLAIAKVISNYAKINKLLTLKGGIFEGKVVNAKELLAIAALPSKLELISMLASCLQGSIRNFALSLKALAEQK